MEEASAKVTSVKWMRVWLGFVALILVSLIALWGTGAFDLWTTGVVSDVKISRYVLGRWPRDWDEVEVAVKRFPYNEEVKLGRIDSVSISSTNSSKCTLTIIGSNYFFFKRRMEIDVEWSSRDELYYKAEENRRRMVLLELEKAN